MRSLGRLFAIQGKAVGPCHFCEQVRSCKVFLQSDGNDVLVCKPCRQEQNLRTTEKDVSLSEAKERIRQHRGGVRGWDV